MSRTTVITGASSDIGQAIITQLVKEGDTVVLLGRNTSKLRAITHTLETKHVDAIPMHIDLSNIKNTRQVITRLTQVIQHIDTFIYAAGVYHDGTHVFADIPYSQYKPEEILTTMHVGITSPMLLCQSILPRMNKNGTIVAISGTFEDGAKGWLPYYVSKQALERLTIGLSHELTDSSIRVNCVSPSDTRTSTYRTYFPQYAAADASLAPQDVADVVGFLCSPQARHISGQIIEVKRRG
jgi:3-oxoacyl-[acyl-carrier protein] reductase